LLSDFEHSQKNKNAEYHLHRNDIMVTFGAMLEACHKLQPKPKTIPELKDALLWIWTALQQKSIANGVKDFHK